MTQSQESARHYARIRYRLLLVNLAASVGFLWLYQASGWSAASAVWWAARAGSTWLIVAGYLLTFGVIQYAVFLPLHWYSSFVLEHRFGLSRMTAGAWLIRELKQIALSGLLGLALMEGLYAILRAAPEHWPLIATAGWVLVTVVLARVFPTFIVPLFYKTTPLTDDSLVKRLLALCERVQLPALGVFRVGLGAETRKANAALAGLGRTRRVLLSDTLLEHFTPEEIETVLAHELGHFRHRHIMKFLYISVVGAWLAFWLARHLSVFWLDPFGLHGLSDIAGFPLLMLAFSVMGLAAMPIQNAISRHFEWQSDVFAVDATRQPGHFAAALEKLGTLNLADPSPPAWIEVLFYDHPAIAKRVAAARAAAV